MRWSSFDNLAFFIEKEEQGKQTNKGGLKCKRFLLLLLLLGFHYSFILNREINSEEYFS